MIDSGILVMITRNYEVSLHSRKLELLTQPEVARQLENNPLIILPAGSVEQHGPHLPAEPILLLPILSQNE